MVNTEQNIEHLINLNTANLVSPQVIKKLYPLDLNSDLNINNFVFESRKAILEIINNQNKKMLLIVGPCSIHDPDAAIEYAKKLKKISNIVNNKILIVMRVYFSKPRTSIGWQGFINDPFLDNSNKINIGLAEARKLLIKINKIGLPVATEFLDNITPQYIIDLISWAAIGARSVESQTLRNFVSGLTLPVGFKNSTSGKVNSAIDALIAASQSNLNMTIDDEAKVIINTTEGNLNTHLILRGGSVTGPNYDETSIKTTLADIKNYKKYNINNTLMVDCSHGNSRGDYNNQIKVFNNILEQLKQDYGKNIKGIMIESFLKSGRQDLNINPNFNKTELEYGVSITDSCLGWEDTAKLIMGLYKNIMVPA